MTNTNLLKSKMLAAGDDHFTDKIKEIINVTAPTANKKLNGKSDFLQSEIYALAKHYGWTAKDVSDIFFGGL